MQPTDDQESSQTHLSVPVYSGLKVDLFAKRHVILAEGEGAHGVLELFREADAGFSKRVTLLYVANTVTDQALIDEIECLGADIFCLCSDIPLLLQECAQRMEALTMETRMYLCGTSSFIGKVAGLATQYGVGFDSLRTEHRGSLAKRVQCVHCKATEEQVLSDFVRCSQCKVRLIVRNHYSHRINAFLGVSIEAEETVSGTPVSKLAS